MNVTLEKLETKHRLSQRTYNVCRLNGLHNLESILDYYLTYDSFTALRNCGNKSNQELITLCDYYLNTNTIQEVNEREEIINANTSIEKLAKHFNLSTRSFNTCTLNNLNTLGTVILHYKQYQSFKNLQNCGEKSNKELIALCNSYSDITVEKNIKHKQYDFLTKRAINAIIINKMIDKIETLDKRSANLVQTLLSKYNNQTYPIFHYLSDINFDFKKINQISKNSTQQLTNYFNSIFTFAQTISTYSEDKLEKIHIISKFRLKFPSLSKQTEEWLTNNYLKIKNDSSNIFRLIQIMLENNDLIEKRQAYIFLNSSSYLNSDKKTLKDLASNLNISRERVRQLSTPKQLEQPFWNEVLKLITLTSMEIGFNGFDFSTSSENYFSFNQKDDFSDFFTTEFYNKFYSLFIDSNLIPISNNKEDKYYPKYLVHKKILNIIDVFSLRNELEVLCNDKIVKSYEINLKGFLYKFATQTETLLNSLQEVIEAIENVIYQEFEILTNLEGNIIIERNTAKQVHEYIYEILEEANTPLHIKELFKRINDIDDSILRATEITAIRSHLLRYPNMFINTALSTYGLKKWEIEGRQIDGTIKDVVEKYLEKYDTPKHIQEITDFVTQYRNTNKNSIYRNLQVDTHKKFIIFGYGFVGLTSKQYSAKDTIFNQLPTVSIRFFERDYFLNGKSQFDFDTLIHIFAKKNNLLEIQVRSSLLDKISAGTYKLVDNYLYKV